MKRLLIIYPYQYGYHTDSYKYCEYLNSEFDITYVCFDLGLPKLDHKGIKVVYCNYNLGKTKRIYGYFNTILQLTRNSKYDLVFTIRFKLCFILGLFLPIKIKILDYRSGDLNRNRFFLAINNAVLRFDALFFNNITVISEGLRDLLLLSKKKTHILPLGADIFYEGSHSFDKFYLLYVGTFSLRNIHQTIEGVNLFVDRYPHLRNILRYDIIGFGNEEDEKLVIGKIKEFKLGDLVIYHGRKKYDELSECFVKANVGVAYVPITRYFDYQPVTKLFEYMLSGMPVIATETRENKKTIRPNTGILIRDNPESFCNGLKELYDNRHIYDSNEIRASVNSITWEQIVNSNLKPYLLQLANSNT